MARTSARWSTGWGLLGLLGVAVLAGCGSDPSSAVNDKCSLNSMCNKPLVCAFDHCHTACVESRDCPSMQRCVRSPDGNVCQYDPACAYKSNCPAPLTCALDRQCRNECLVDGDCPTKTQKCVQPDKVCAEPIELDLSGTHLLNALATPVPDSPDAGVDDGGASDAEVSPPDAAAPIDAPAVPSDAAGPLGFAPSNFTLPAAGVGDAGAPGPVAISQPTCDNRCLPAPTMVMLADGSLADLYVVTTFRVETTAVLTLTGTRPIVIAALDSVDIAGQLSVAAAIGVAGPGGFSSGVLGPGAGGMGQTAAAMGSGAGGGAYCGIGGRGGAPMAGATAAPGKAYGSPALIPLIGGSPGGTASYYGVVSGGGGGGALQIVARNGIKVGAFGLVNAGGGGGSPPAAGGGSGGAILLEAPTVSIAGHVTANGGGGGGGMGALGGNPASADDQPAAAGGAGGKGSAATVIDGTDAGMEWSGGGGGAGRIRINTASGSATVSAGAIISPGLTTTCATQGRLGG